MYHAISTYTAELMHQYISADNGEIVYNYLTCHFGRVTYDTVITDKSVMSYMHTFHQQVVVTDNGSAFGSRTAIDGDIFTNGIVVTDFSGTLFSLKFQILRDSTDNSSRKNSISIADT